MLTLYDYPRSRNGYKIRLLMAHVGRPLAVVSVDLLAGESRQPAFLAKSPLGRVPLLELEDGRILSESNAILYYLAEGTPYWPDDRLTQAEVLRWMFYEQNVILPGVGTARFLKITGNDQKRPDVYAQRLELARDGLSSLERHLSTGRAWFVGDAPTLADIALFAYLRETEAAGLSLADWPSVFAWRDRFAALPGHIEPDAGFAAAASV